MSGDIEDFLRRAAERRQARQGNRPAPAASPARHEYSDARRERLPQARPDDDELVVAEVIEEPMSRKLAELRQAQAAAQATREANAHKQASLAKRLKRAERAAAKTQAQRSTPQSPLRSNPATSLTAAVTPPPEPDLIVELQEALRTPHGLRSAMLLHEILARPEHRW